MNTPFFKFFGKNILNKVYHFGIWVFSLSYVCKLYFSAIFYVFLLLVSQDFRDKAFFHKFMILSFFWVLCLFKISKFARKSTHPKASLLEKISENLNFIEWMMGWSESHVNDIWLSLHPINKQSLTIFAFFSISVQYCTV